MYVYFSRVDHSTVLTIPLRTAIPCTLMSFDKTFRCTTSRGIGCGWPIARLVSMAPKIIAAW